MLVRRFLCTKNRDRVSLYVLLFAKCALAPSHIVTPHNLQHNRDPRGNIHGRDIEIHETASLTLARISVNPGGIL